MFLIPIRSGLSASVVILGLGFYLLHQVFLDSGKDMLVVVVFAPVLCSLGLILLWVTIAHHRSFRRWELYRKGQNHSSTLPS